ncbi:MAG: hypothetical protein AAF799_32505 [Myxococcota bacterium]
MRTAEPAFKDEERARPVASAWRSVIGEVVEAFAAGDYALSRVASVAIDARAVAQIEHYVADFGETLVALPEATWSTSVSQWMGTHWDVLVDLWTVESGASDLALSARVHETDDGVRFEILSVHVP